MKSKIRVLFESFISCGKPSNGNDKDQEDVPIDEPTSNAQGQGQEHQDEPKHYEESQGVQENVELEEMVIKSEKEVAKVKITQPNRQVGYLLEASSLFALLDFILPSFSKNLLLSPGMALSLEDFLVRARVLKLYRHALRVSRRAPSHARGDLRQIIRQEMDNNRNCNDKQRIRFLISEGLERVKRLDETLDMQGH